MTVARHAERRPSKCRRAIDARQQRCFRHRPKPMPLAPAGRAPPIDRGARTPLEPLGDARNKLGGCVAPVKANVPAVVTGDPETLNQGGAASPTLVTVPGTRETAAILDQPRPRPARDACPAVTIPD